MGRRLGRSGFYPDLVLVSPALRTRQTAQALWAAMGTAPRSEIEPALYMAGSRELLELIQASDAGVVHLALIGHNPGLTALANQLGARSIDNIPTAGIVQFQIDSDRWSPLELNQVQWIDFDFPKQAPRT
jgi:phosphohistidine phosphatase